MDLTYYLINLILCGLGRFLDIGSTWYASRTLLLESNLLAKKMGWKGILIFNIAICFLAAIDFHLSLIIFVVSALAASNNVGKAWVTQTVGEEEYSEIFKEWVRRAELKRLVFSNIGSSIIFLSIGLFLMFFTLDSNAVVVGFAFVIFSCAIIFHRTVAFYKIRKDREATKNNS